MSECMCRGHKVVVFVLDEFDLFARKPRQTLLYNLLDAMQASDMQVPNSPAVAQTIPLWSSACPSHGLQVTQLPEVG